MVYNPRLKIVLVTLKNYFSSGFGQILGSISLAYYFPS